MLLFILCCCLSLVWYLFPVFQLPILGPSEMGKAVVYENENWGQKQLMYNKTEHPRQEHFVRHKQTNRTPHNIQPVSLGYLKKEWKVDQELCVKRTSTIPDCSTLKRVFMLCVGGTIHRGSPPRPRTQDHRLFSATVDYRVKGIGPL